MIDPADGANGPVPGTHDWVVARWRAMPAFLRDLFVRSFTVGLLSPEARVLESEWRSAMARLREKTTGGQPILLRTNMDAGHGGASGRFQRLEEVAFEYAFAIKVAGKM